MTNYYQHLRLLFKRILLIVLLFTLTRLFFFLINYQTFGKIPFSEVLKIFFWGIKFDLSAIVYLNFPIILMHIIPGEFKNKRIYQYILKGLFILINSFLLLTNLADSEYFKFTKKRASAYVFEIMGFGNMENDVMRQLPKFIIDYWYILVTWIFIIFLLFVLFSNLKTKKIKIISLNTREIILQSFLFILLCGFCIFIGRGGFQLKPLRIINAAQYTAAENIPLLLNTPFSIMKTFGKSKLKEREYFTAKELNNIYNPECQYKSDSAFKKMNVVVFILESFSKEYIGSLNKNSGYTPFLDSLITKSKTFANAFANGTQSIEAVPSILTSLPSIMDNPLITSYYASNELNSIASLLKKEGYFTALFHGLTNGSMGFDNFAKVAQIDKYYGRTEYNNEKDYDGQWGIYDEEFLQYTAQELNKQNKPFFACIMTLSSHHPYTVPKKYKTVFTKGDVPIHKVISYADFALKRFFKTATKMPWYKNTLFVFTADHTGPAQSQYYKNEVGRFAIPIIYYCPSDTTLIGINDSTVTQQTDIFPSIMDYLHYKNKFVAFGNSVFSSKKPNFAFNYLSGVYQLIEDNYIILFDGEKAIGLFDLRTDKLLKNNLIKNNLKVSKHLENKIKAIIQQYSNRLIENKLIIK